MSKIEQNRELKRQAILKAALEVFVEDGYVNAKMDRISSVAQVTKQTVYRYFPSKKELFAATLKKIGEKSEFGFIDHLQESDTEIALQKFANDFVRAHLSAEHIAIFKLLIAENSQAPEMMSSFHEEGPNKTDVALTAFFKQRLNVDKPELMIRMWTGMLLSMRTRVLMGGVHPSNKEIDEYTEESVRFLRSALAEY